MGNVQAAAGLVLLLTLCPNASAAPPEIPLSAFRAQVSAAEQLVSACRASPTACDGRSLPAEAQVRGENAVPGFHADWQWLHDALDKAAKASSTERSATMGAAAAHLAELSAQTSAAGANLTPAARLPEAHAAAARVLARDEFLTDSGPTWLDRQLARLQDWFLRIFTGAGRVGARNPWIASSIEWLCFGFAAASLLFFVRRSLARQSLRISLAGGAPVTTGAGRSSTDWLREAAAAEAAGQGRETIHCLYWAAITSLETRKAWSPNPTRTPREYVRLLRSNSATQQALRDLTGRFERTWYGSAEPTAAQVQSAKQDLATIGASSLERSSENGVPARASSVSPISPLPTGAAT